MFPLPMARTVLQRLLDEIEGRRRGLAAGEVPPLDAMDRKIATYTDLLDQLPGDFARLRTLAEEERDFQSAFAETRLKALAEHCRIALGVIDRLAG